LLFFSFGCFFSVYFGLDESVVPVVVFLFFGHSFVPFEVGEASNISEEQTGYPIVNLFVIKLKFDTFSLNSGIL